MSEIPVIVISSPKPHSGKTTLTLNLAAALWSDGYSISLFAPDNEKIINFINSRQKFCEDNKIDLPVPELMSEFNCEGRSNKKVIIAVIPTAQNKEYSNVFASAHTLITIAAKPNDMQWNLNDSYINLIWDAKKEIAARGIKYLNWIAIADLQNKTAQDWSDNMIALSKRYGFRISDSLKYRTAYQCVDKGYCAADMLKDNKIFNMSYEDVYARREILKLTDTLWQNK